MSADSDMVERVAAAMAAVDRGEGYKVLARAALDASGIGELVEAAYEFQCAVHMNASTRTLEVADRRLTAALSRARATGETNSE